MCLSRVPVYNKEKKTYTYHNCGKCIECMNEKSLRYVNMLQNQFSLSNTQMSCLVSLHYNNKNVPLVKVVHHKVNENPRTKVRLPFPDENGNKFSNTDLDFQPFEVVKFYLVTQRCIDHYGVRKIDEVYGYTDDQKKYINHLLKPITSGKVRGTDMAKRFLPYNHFPILFHKDVQLYVKRVRDKIYNLLIKKFGYTKKTLTYEQKEKIRLEVSKIKVFYVGEYGPQSFRPHYHLLLFFDCDFLKDAIKEILCTSWTLGSLDFQFCDSSGAGRYVSEYCNSFVGLPPIYKYSWSKAKSFHSIRIGVSESEEFDKDLREVSFASLREKVIRRNGKFKQSTYPLSVESYLFPKCYRFNESVDSLQLARYTIFDTVANESRKTKVKDIVSFFANEKFGYFYKDIHPYYSNDILFEQSSNRISTFRSMLYISRKFLKNCERYNLSPFNYLRIINQYHDDKNSYTLKQWYKQMEEDSKVIDSHYLVNYYNNIPKDDIKNMNHDLINLFAEQIDDSFENVHFALNHENLNRLLFAKHSKIESVINKKIKHKEQNDRNINFIHYE